MNALPLTHSRLIDRERVGFAPDANI